MRRCPNIKESPEGFDGKKQKCTVCGYGEFFEGMYYKWVKKPEPVQQPECLNS